GADGDEADGHRAVGAGAPAGVGIGRGAGGEGRGDETGGARAEDGTAGGGQGSPPWGVRASVTSGPNRGLAEQLEGRGSPGRVPEMLAGTVGGARGPTSRTDHGRGRLLRWVRRRPGAAGRRPRRGRRSSRRSSRR